MKRLFAVLLALAFLIQPVLAKAAPLPEAEIENSEGYIVRMSADTDLPSAVKTGCEPIGNGLFYAPTLKDLMELAALGSVEYWEPNYVFTIQDAYDGYEPDSWSLRSVEANAAWSHKNAEGERDRLGNGVTVAIVDSGVMADHPDLQSADILDAVVLSSDDDGIDGYHGTFIAGILAAAVNNGMGIDGTVPNVTILPICITASGGRTDAATAIRGINTAAEMGADVILFCIGGTNDDSALREACEAATAKGIIFVTCAGNYTSGRNRSAANYMYPAAYDCAVTVSACRQSGDGAAFDDDYSYFNDAVTVSAPGTDIVSLYVDGGTATKTGTSFSAPYVAAMAAIAK
ncbi:MAG: S8 family serine peptidase, partial [Oscillospiraceae bacterium]|nr:S8 family serine peptidase [Oscillospiraceae bacterium]